jgi:large subunit ribosomal protein L9
MQVILKETMDNLGPAGSIVRVKDGYARNYLIPKDLAAPATAGMARRIEHIKRLAEKKRLHEVKTAQDLKDRLETIVLTLQARVGEKDKLYGSVTTADLAKELADQGVEVNRRKIVLDHPIRSVGTHSVTVKIDPEVSATIKVIVEGSEEEIKGLTAEPAVEVPAATAEAAEESPTDVAPEAEEAAQE